MGRPLNPPQNQMTRQLLTTLFLCSLITLLIGCSDEELPGQASVPENYPDPVEEWQEYRIGVLTDSTGWLRLADLIWLSDGENRFGTAPDAAIRFPEGSMPNNGGVFTKLNGTVQMEVLDGVEVTHHQNGETVQSMTIFDADSDDDRPICVTAPFAGLSTREATGWVFAYMI